MYLELSALWKKNRLIHMLEVKCKYFISSGLKEESFVNVKYECSLLLHAWNVFCKTSLKPFNLTKPWFSVVGENIHLLNAFSQPSFQTGETMLTKTLQSVGQILKGMLIARSYKLICVGWLRCFRGNTLASKIHPHKPLPKIWAPVIAQPLIRHIPAEISHPLGHSGLVLAALKAS